MTVSLDDLGKKFINQWLFREISLQVHTGRPLAVTGPNGSGKSTLLKIISGWMLPSKGSVNYLHDGIKIPPERIFRQIDYVAPYIELIEELSLTEFLNFHFTHKKIREGFSAGSIAEILYLEKDSDKYIKYFSSGMKQRLKLGLGFFSESPVLLLDEPTTNLDEPGKSWYKNQVEKLIAEKLIIIASNQPEDYFFTDNSISLTDYTYV
jgi:ABC-type multidrug transport system ATPase subunit